MISNYFKIAWRNLLRNKAISVINIVGLALGLTACMLIALFVQNELSYDGFHEKGDRIVRVVMEYGNDAEREKVKTTGTKVAPAFKRTFPEVEAGVRMYITNRVVKSGDKLFKEKNFYYADSSFFDIFSFKLLAGNAKDVLVAPNTVVLSERTAKKYFEQENPIGKIIRIDDAKDYVITGIAADCPKNSQIQFDFLASFTSLRAAREEENWYTANWTTFLLLKDQASIESLQAKIAPFLQTQFSKEEYAESSLNYLLEPYTKVHLYSDVENSFQPNSNISYLYIFSAVALLILLIACFTYMNVTTASATERAKEIGMRKVMGAFRKQVFLQFMAESAIMVSLVLVISGFLTAMFLPAFNELVDKELSFSAIFLPSNLFFMVGIGLVTTFLAGAYPAILLSGFQPIKVLKGTFKTSFSGLMLRKSLIVFQFSISIFLIIATLIIQNQLQFIQNKKLGYNKEHVLVLPTDQKINEKLSTLKSVFKSNPDVLGVTGAYETPVFINGGYAMWGEGMAQGNRIPIAAIPSDEHFVQTMGMDVVAGTDLVEADMKRITNEDATKNYFYFILNESAVKHLGWTNENAVGRKMDLGDARQGEVKAVVKDFHFASLHQKIEPLVIFPDSYFNTIMVKLSGENMPQTIGFLTEKWKEIAPHRPFDYEFMDEEFNRLYAAESQIGKAFNVFAFLAIFLACLGLYGLATFTTAQRSKEIGIRKVLGASIVGITGLLAQDFLKLVLIAIIIASPIAYYFMHNWLADFAYGINIQWWMFAAAGIAALAIAFLTVGGQAVKAALANPVQSLRSE